MGDVIKARISSCPECGEDEWWMEVDTGRELTEEQRLRRDAARHMFDEARSIQRNRGLFGLFRRRLAPESIAYEDPSSPDHIRCANCGHEMSLGQSGDQQNKQHDWPIS